MLFWVINGGIFLVYSLICFLYHKESTFLRITFIQLTFISAFRGIKVGTDTYNYCNIYSKIASGSFNGSVLIPKGSLLEYYYKIISFIFVKENGYMISTSIPTMIGFYLLIKKYSRNYYLAVYFFVSSYIYFFSMNAGRQMLAVAVTILSFILWNERRFVASIVAYLVAIQIHNSAIIFGVYFLVSMVKWNFVFFVIFSGASFVICRSVVYLIGIFVKLFPRYQWMIRKSYIYELASRGRLSVVYALICFFSILMMLYWILHSENNIVIKLNNYVEFASKVRMKEVEIQFYYRIMAMLMLSGILYVVYPTVIIFTRMSYYLFVYFLLLLPEALEKMNHLKKTAIVTIYVAFFITFVYQLQGGYSGVLEYKFYDWGIFN